MQSITLIAALSFLATGSLAHADTTGSSYTPIVGYDDKNGALYGAAAFFYDEGGSAQQKDFVGVTNGGSFEALMVNLSKRTERGYNLSWKSNVARTFDQYYGEGDRTLNQNALLLKQDSMQTDLAALVPVAELWSVGPSLGMKGRQEKGVQRLDNGAKVDQRAFADSANPSVGVRAVYDSRDSRLSTTHGTLLSVDVRALPSNLALMDGAQDAGLASAEWREFVQLTPGTVLAHRLAGGGSMGEPAYQDRYSLGGTMQMRGFQENRFRGRQFYCMQEELRVPLYKALSLASSVDLGDISDGQLGRPRHSVQAGLRAGLPPSYGMKARLDVGYGDTGERSLALQFGETF